MTEVKTEKEQTRVRINYKVSAKGVYQPDITSEAETVETAMENLKKASVELATFATMEGTR